jgi:4a-hydroxytetrahydrobiopterin dehydratase
MEVVMSAKDLARKECVPCKGGVPALESEDIRKLADQVDGWKVVENHHIEKTYKFDDFAQALEFVNKVGAIAEDQDHHPEIWFTWGKARVTIHTHAVDGLTENDFILAAKIDESA